MIRELNRGGIDVPHRRAQHPAGPRPLRPDRRVLAAGSPSPRAARGDPGGPARPRGLPRCRLAAHLPEPTTEPTTKAVLTCSPSGGLRRVRRRARPAGRRPRVHGQDDHLHRRPQRRRQVAPSCASSAGCSSRELGEITSTARRSTGGARGHPAPRASPRCRSPRRCSPHMTVHENVLLGGYLIRKDRKLLTRAGRPGRGARPARRRTPRRPRREPRPAASGAWSRSRAASCSTPG